jgi:hypothetical protein
MLKKIAIFMTVLLMASSVTLADPILPGSVQQVQNFTVGDMVNPGMGIVLTVTHGDAGASAIQSLDIDNVQSSPCLATPCWNWPCGFGNSCDVEAAQAQNAELNQDATAGGKCGIITVDSFLDAVGEQEQFIGFSTAPKSQIQGLGLASQQVLTRSDGSGGADSTNDALLEQNQAGSNAAGSVFECSTIDAHQANYTAGAANSTTALATSLVATTSQAQQVY